MAPPGGHHEQHHHHHHLERHHNTEAVTWIVARSRRLGAARPAEIPRGPGSSAQRQTSFQNLTWDAAVDAFYMSAELATGGWSPEARRDLLAGYGKWLAEMLIDAAKFGSDWYELAESAATGGEVV